MSVRLQPGSFYGKVQQRHELPEMTFVESSYPPGMRVPRHSHVRAYFYLLLRGSCTETFEHQARPVRSLTLVFHPPECLHASEWERQGGSCFSIELSDALLERLSKQATLADQFAEFPSGEPVWLGVRLYREFRRKDALSCLAMEGITLEILAATARARISPSKPKPAPWLARVRDLLHDRFAESFALGEIADLMGVHAVHLCRAFRQEFGCTMGDYIRGLRVAFASRKLSRSTQSLAEIALAAGFVDQSHFANTFRRCTGMTPGAFRRQFSGR